jgi:hypothetical protein
MTSPRRDVRWHYEIRDVARLPPVRDLEGPPCMTGQARLDCCWYHRIDWHAVSEAAIRLALQAQAGGTPPGDVADVVDPASCGLGGDDVEALDDLLRPETGIEIDDDDPHDQRVQEGRHRITAMRDAGVRRTVLLRPELIEATGDPRKPASPLPGRDANRCFCAG